MLLRPKPKPRNPGKSTLSPTKISTYLECRAKYKFTYIDKIGRFYYKPKSYHSFGASIHRTLEEFHRLGGAETQSSDQLIDKLTSTWTSVGYDSAAEEEKRLGDAAEMLQSYHKEYRTEHVKTLFNEKQLKWDMGEIYLIGRLDRLDEHLDGKLDIVDYKSGRQTVTEGYIRDDLPMGIYAYLASKIYPNRIIAATIYCLRTASKATATFTSADLISIEEAVLAIASDILQTDADSEIESEWQPEACPGCDYLRLCARRMRWNVDLLIKPPAD